MLLIIAVAFTTCGAASPGSCQTQYNNSSSQCDTQYQLDIQVSDAFSSATGGLSYGTMLRRDANKKYSSCISRAISARDNCNSNGVK